MSTKKNAISEKPVVEPRQSRSKATYRSLLAAAQKILVEEGLEGLNSNAIVERAGLTAPAFYRYFEDKHAMLAALGRNLMNAQNAVLETALADVAELPGALVDQTRALLWRTLKVTEAFEGGYALIGIAPCHSRAAVDPPRVSQSCRPDHGREVSGGQSSYSP